MTIATACFIIAIITGLFFGTGILLIRRIKPRGSEWPDGVWTGNVWKASDPDSTNTGAAEGDDRSFRHPDDGQ